MTENRRKLAAIMFADIVGYTAMMQENEDLAKRIRDRHRTIVQEQVESHAGEVVQYYGDGALSIFPSAKQSVLAARAIQGLLRQDPKVPLRIGIHLGDIVHDDEGVFGDGVNVASRIESMAVTGSVLFSDRVFEEISNHPTIRTVDLGEFSLKNVKRAVRVFALDHESLVVPQSADIISGKQERKASSIAVMPFAEMSHSEAQDYFGEGVSQEIISGLSTVDDLSVISRATCNAIINSPDGPLAMGRKLNVTHFLEGSVRRAGDRVRVSVQLVNTSDGFQVWADTYDRNLHDIFEVQDEIAHKVVNALKVNFDKSTADPIVSRATDNMEAYTLHLKGLHLWRKNNPEDARKAVSKLEEALRVDPGYAASQSVLSQCYSYLGSCGAIPPVDAYAKALNYAMTAVENDPKFAEGHLALANIKFYHFWDWEAARISLEKAEALGLNSTEMHQSYGLYYAAVGKPELGIPKMLRALELDPLSVPVMSMLGTLYLFNEQFDEAISVFDEILELEPTFRSSYNYKGIAFACQKKYEKALEAFEIYHKMVNHPQKALIGLVLCHDALGHQDRVEELLQRLHTRLEEESTPAAEIDLAIINAGLGNYSQSLELLERLYENRLSVACMGMIWVVRCPIFKDFWEQPGFRKLKKKMGLN